MSGSRRSHRVMRSLPDSFFINLSFPHSNYEPTKVTTLLRIPSIPLPLHTQGTERRRIAKGLSTGITLPIVTAITTRRNPCQPTVPAAKPTVTTQPQPTKSDSSDTDSDTEDAKPLNAYQRPCHMGRKEDMERPLAENHSRSPATLATGMQQVPQAFSTITAKNVVSFVAEAMLELRLTQWYQAGQLRIDKLPLDEYFAELQQLVLDKNWAHDLQEEILNNRQEHRNFYDWKIEQQNKNAILSQPVPDRLYTKVEVDELLAKKQAMVNYWKGTALRQQALLVLLNIYACRVHQQLNAKESKETKKPNLKIAHEAAAKDKEDRCVAKQDHGKWLEEWRAQMQERDVENEKWKQNWTATVAKWKARAAAKAAGHKLKDWDLENPQPKRQSPEFCDLPKIDKPRLTAAIDDNEDCKVIDVGSVEDEDNSDSGDED
ncbi:hypothetical protein FA15DRAFT_661826 [Coprinopsis marcescibilis]|uniref:Uncharacterized protein n=1 Tax=Coprinopsis marcescibilis TaxID=230819 RepID=A0A5C3KA10_COPMA|nr:hypothetical protein FA15DRAFT_661826 [Coprinopsis marcescibilis]